MEDTWTSKLILRPVGVVRSALKTPLSGAHAADLDLKTRIEMIREQHRQIKGLASDLVIAPRLEGILEGIEDFSHIVVVYWPHLIPAARRALLHVRPMGRKDLPQRGIFATRSPARPNPLLISTVRLLERNGNVLRVQALEAVDGSPILDIKPYTEIYQTVVNPRFPGWLRKIHRDLEEDTAEGHVS